MDNREEGINRDVADDAEVESTSSCFDLDLTVTMSGDQRQVEVDFACGDGGEAANVELQMTSAEEAGGGDVGAVVLKDALAALGPAARLRGLVLRKLRKSKAAGKLAGGGGAASPEGDNRFLATPRSEAYAIAGEERRATRKPKVAAHKYLSKITSSLARRRRVRDSSPARHSQATAVAVGSARGGPTTSKTTRRSSMAAAAPPTLLRGRDGSAQHLQDGIESAIAHCKLPLRAATSPS